MNLNEKLRSLLSRLSVPKSASQWWNVSSWTVIAAGIVVRLFLLLDDRSLWLDEAALASGVTNFGMNGLLPENLGNQTAPLGEESGFFSSPDLYLGNY